MSLEKKIKYLISGVSGQDGLFSALYFLRKGHEVFGLSRQSLSRSHPFVKLLQIKFKNFHYIHIPTYHLSSVQDLFLRVRPDRVIHCAGFRDIPKNQIEIDQCYFTNCHLVEMFLTALASYTPECRFLFLSSAEIFAHINSSPLDENSPIGPQNEYGISKVKGMEIIESFKLAKNIFAMSAICFNHDSILSPSSHLVKLVIQKLLKLKNTLCTQVSFFNVQILRDWSHVKDFVMAFQLMLEQKSPENFVVASGVSYTLLDYIKLCCNQLNITFDQNILIESLPQFDTYSRVANPARIKTKLGWNPEYDIQKIISELINWEEERYNLQSYKGDLSGDFFEKYF